MEEFKENDLYKLFVYYLVKNGVTIFHERDFSSKMKSYLDNDNFNELFWAIKMEQLIFNLFSLPLSLNNIFHKYQVDESDSFNQHTYDFSSLKEDTNSCISTLREILGSYSPRHHQLVKELVDDYLKLYNFERSFYFPLFIKTTNPNDYYYYLTDGIYDKNGQNSHITWNIITDTSDVYTKRALYLNDKEESIVDVLDPNVLNIVSDINHSVDKLISGVEKKLIVKNASWVMLQGFENDLLKSAYLYTEITDLEKLKQIIALASSINKVPLSKYEEDPVVYTIK